jgi:hypothetical protein
MYNSPKQKGVILFYKHPTGRQMVGIIKGSSRGVTLCRYIVWNIKIKYREF